MVIFWGYARGGHRRAEKVAVYYTTFAVIFFIFSIVMWGVGAAILSQSKAHGNGQDIWGWSCKDNKRRALFQNDVSYALICRLQVRYSSRDTLKCALTEL
jgi:predicted permease